VRRSRSAPARPQELVDVERLCCKDKGAVVATRPVLAWSIPTELDAVAVGVVEAEGLARSVVSGAIETNARRQNALQGSRKCLAGRVADGAWNSPVFVRGGGSASRLNQVLSPM